MGVDSEKIPGAGNSLSISADDPAEFSGGVAAREPMLLRLLGRWTSSGGLGRRFSVALMIVAALAGAATFFAITNVSRFGITQESVLVLLVIDLALVLEVDEAEDEERRHQQYRDYRLQAGTPQHREP